MVGNNIRKIMKEKGLTQAEVAKLANISQASLSAIINGSKPKAETLYSLAQVLGVEISELEKTAELSSCPRCGSRCLSVWQNVADGSSRVRCGYCELDSGEQKSLEKAYDVMATYHKGKQHINHLCSVVSLSELLDSIAYDSNDVRPVWFENRGLFVVPSLLQCGIAEREMDLVRVLWVGEHGFRTFRLDQYGSWWRVWSGKPTTGQVESEPWED